jgi:hypothetical protein
MRLWLLVAALCLGAGAAPAMHMGRAGGGAPFVPPSGAQLCGGSLPSCLSAESTERQLVSGATKAIQVERSVDSTTQDVGFTSGGLVNTATVDTFCNARVAGVISRNCWLSRIYEQGGNSNCDVYNITQADLPVYQVDPNHQGLPMFNKVFQGSGVRSYLLDNNGGVTTAVTNPCSILNGTTPQSFFYAGNSKQGSLCCGNTGLMENTVGVVTGAMFAALAGQTGLSFGACSSVSPNPCGGIDSEGVSGALANFTPTTSGDYIDQVTSVGGAGAVNLWINGTQLIFNETSSQPLATQGRMVWGTAGDGTGSGPMWSRTETFYGSALNSTQIANTYSNEINFVASLTLGYQGPGDLFQQASANVSGGYTNQLQYLSSAWTLRKAYAAYEGPALNVCQGQGSGATCEDIGFVNNVIDTTTLSAFCGPVSGLNDCAVQIWYNQALPQAGTSNVQTTTYDMVASSTTTRPTIAFSGCPTTTITVCVITNGGSNYFVNSVSPGPDGGGFTFAVVAARTANFTTEQVIWGFDAGAYGLIGWNNAANTCLGSSHAGLAVVTATCSADGAAHSIIMDFSQTASLTTLWTDGVAGGTNTSGGGGLLATAAGLGATNTGADPCTCQISEVLIYANYTASTFNGIGSSGVAALWANERTAFGF